MPGSASSLAEWRHIWKFGSLRSTLGLAGTAGPVIVASVFVALVIAALVLWLWYDRVQTVADGERIASNLARVLEEQTGRTFQAVDLTLAGIVDALRLTPSLGEHDPEFERALRRKKATLPYVRALFVIGPDGFITQDSDHPYTPRVTLADRGYFIAHAEDPKLELYVGPPLISRSVGTWFVSMSRRIENPDGSFGGIAVAAIEPSYFQTFYQALALGPDDSIALFNDDGVLIARSPHLEGHIGQAFAEFELFDRLQQSRSGTYHLPSALDGVQRIFSYRVLDAYPLVVTVGLSEEALLDRWRNSAAGAVAVALLIAVLVGGLTMLVLRQQRQRELARGRLARVQSLEALGHLTGGIAHDFRNLLAVVAAGATRIQRHSADGDIRRTTDVIAGAVERGDRLIGQMLAFARQQELTIQTEDANAMLRELETLLRYAAGPGVRLTFDLAPALRPCLTDRGQFDVAMLNLVVNARDAMPAGGEVRIATANRRVDPGPVADSLPAGDYTRVTVTDTGEGMPPEVQQRALDPYFTTKAETGTGLGLSQVYGFVRQVGGDLQIESRVGVGTSVHLFFPRADGPAPQPDRAA